MVLDKCLAWAGGSCLFVVLTDFISELAFFLVGFIVEFFREACPGFIKI